MAYNLVNHLRTGACLLALAPCLAVPLASAQEVADAAAQSRDEGMIIVTARKRDELLQDVPASIAVVSAQQMAERGITGINDLERQTPGLVLNRRQDDSPNVVLRGVGSFGNVQGVGFYVDEVQNFTDQAMRLNDLERVEILKGPQGTLYGGSNIGGAIRYISKLPRHALGVEASGEGGSRGYYDLYGSVNAPLASDTLALRVSGYYTHNDGYLFNSVVNAENGETTEYGARGPLLWEPRDDFSALLTVRYRNRDGGYQSDTSFIPRLKEETLAVVLNMGVDFGFAELRSISSFTRQKQAILFDLDYTPDPILAVESVDARPAQVFTQELRLTSKASDRFDYILGLYAARIENNLTFPTPVGLSIGGGPLILPFGDQTSLQEDLAAFATTNFHFGDVTVETGARLLHTKYISRRYVNSGVPFSPPETLTTSDTAILPKLTLSYDASDAALLFLSASRGYESGKISAPAGQPAFPYAPETSWSFEAGVKGRLVRALQYEVTAFHILYDNRQFETRSFDDAGLQVERIDNIGKSKAFGVEASAVWTPVTGLRLDAGVGYIDAQWRKGMFGVDDPAAPGGIRPIDLAGQNVPNTPKWRLNAGATYEIPLADGLKLNLHADTSYSSRFRWLLNDVPRSGTNPAYWVSNARIALGAENGRWEIAGRVENLFDKRYYYEFYPEFFGPQAADGSCDKCHLGSPAAPRRFVASATFRY
jgi:iron complex outermembrane receptor protein